jgi:hypothetical protein
MCGCVASRPIPNETSWRSNNNAGHARPGVSTVTDGEIPDTATLRLQLAAMTAEADGPRHQDGWSDEAMRWRPTP